MPDIDMDFDERRRTDMIRYATERYGDDKVAQIITYGTIKAKAAIKDSSRVLGYPYAMGDKITKAFPPPVMGREASLAECFDSVVQALQRRPASCARWPPTSPTSPRSWRRRAAWKASSARSASTLPAS